jgi:hypothetical protein
LRSEIKDKFGGHCAYCGILLKAKGWHVDHVIPYAAGGPEDINNYFPACKHCNSLKNSYSLESFRRTIEDYHTKAGVIVSERFGILQVIGPVKVVFWFEKQGYVFPEELVRTLMMKFTRPDS